VAVVVGVVAACTPFAGITDSERNEGSVALDATTSDAQSVADGFTSGLDAGAPTPTKDGSAPIVCDGPCVPVVIATSSAGADNVAIDEANIYWSVDTATGTVYAAPLAGGPMTPLASNQQNPRGVATDGVYVYFTLNVADGGIMRVPVGGGAVTELATGQGTPRRVLVDTTNVYWTDSDDGTIMKTAKTGVSPPTSLGTTTSPSGLAIDDTYVYFSSTTDSSISRAPIAGGPTMNVGTPPVEGQYPIRLAVDGTNVYATGNTGGSVTQVPKGGGSFTVLASGKSYPGGLAIDSKYVYFAENALDGGVFKVPIGGGMVTQLASGQATPGQVAVDAEFVYWANATDGTIMRVPK
jgi:hypothetical protein